jgi:hypothetical protein
MSLEADEPRRKPEELHDAAVRAVEAYLDWCHYDETLWDAETVEEAITALWDQALGIERDECLLIRHQGERRAVRWNGAAWKPVTLPPAPEVGV